MAWSPEDGTPYMPSNGTEFDSFYSRWCTRCANDDPDGDNCDIIGDSMFGKQPDEWTWKDGKPHCSAFVSFGGMQPKAEPRCPLTKEMF